MPIYNVEFSYNLSVEANNAKEAEQEGMELFDEINPKTEEMNINISIEKENKNEKNKIRY